MGVLCNVLQLTEVSFPVSFISTPNSLSCTKIVYPVLSVWWHLLKRKSLFLLFVRFKAIVTFQHSFLYSHMSNRTTRTKLKHPGMSLFCLVHP